MRLSRAGRVRAYAVLGEEAAGGGAARTRRDVQPDIAVPHEAARERARVAQLLRRLTASPDRDVWDLGQGRGDLGRG